MIAITPKNKPWIVIGVGAAVAVVVYWYVRRASGAAPAKAMSLGPSGLLPGFTPSTGPRTPVPATVPATKPASGIASSSITRIDQAEPVMFNQSKQAWQMAINIYQGVNSTYQIVSSTSNAPPTAAAWTANLATLFGVSPSIIHVNG